MKWKPGRAGEWDSWARPHARHWFLRRDHGWTGFAAIPLVFSSTPKFNSRSGVTAPMNTTSPMISAWSAGPGYYFIRKPSTIVGVQVSRRLANTRTSIGFAGDVAADTGITSVFLGPRVIASRGNWSAEIQAEFPVHIQNTALQIVPDYRLQASVSLHF